MTANCLSVTVTEWTCSELDMEYIVDSKTDVSLRRCAYVCRSVLNDVDRSRVNIHVQYIMAFQQQITVIQGNFLQGGLVK